MNDKEITDKAVKEAKKLKKEIAVKMIDYLPEEETPVSVFMAGSPGAGKTETARNFIKQFESNHNMDIVHIENDELRKEFEDYDGLNSPLFQRPATILVEAIHDRALKKKVSFLLDSTLSSFEKAKSNIERSLNKSRYVLIIFVYQKPEQAWRLVRAREAIEGRRVPAEIFVQQFLNSQKVVTELKQVFQDKIELMFIEKNLDGSSERFFSDIYEIDPFLDKKYNRTMLEEIAGISK